MESYVFANFMFHATPKVIWDAARAIYSLENNASWVFEVYEEVFSLHQSNRSLAEYYSHLGA